MAGVSTTHKNLTIGRYIFLTTRLISKFSQPSISLHWIIPLLKLQHKPLPNLHAGSRPRTRGTDPTRSRLLFRPRPTQDIIWCGTIFSDKPDRSWYQGWFYSIGVWTIPGRRFLFCAICHWEHLRRRLLGWSTWVCWFDSLGELSASVWLWGAAGYRCSAWETSYS